MNESVEAVSRSIVSRQCSMLSSGWALPSSTASSLVKTRLQGRPESLILRCMKQKGGQLGHGLKTFSNDPAACIANPHCCIHSP